MASYSETVTDGLGLDEQFGPIQYGWLGTEGVGFLEATFSYHFQAGGVVTEGLGWDDLLAVAAQYGQTLVDAVTLAGNLLQGMPASIAENMSFTGVLAIARAVAVLEKLGLHGAFSTNSSSQLALIDAISFSDEILDFFGLNYSESLGLEDNFTASFLFARNLSEELGLDSALTSNMAILKVIADGIDFDDGSILEMIFNGQLRDRIGIKVGWVDPGGGFTTWAVNTRTNAVTEYQGFGPFNSFCQIGNQFYGASNDGLFRLDAETDDGANIVADIKGAMLSLGGSRYTQLDGVYLGMRVDDNARDFILKLVQPNAGPGGVDKIYVYQFRPKNMRTAKINIGKGLRTRYLQWELVVPGQDFDLDSIEFVPVISKRRV